MHCKHAQNLLFDHADGQLDPAIAEAVDHHLSSCSNCQQAMADIRAMTELASGWQEQELPAAALPLQAPARIQTAPRLNLAQWLPLAASMVLAVLVLFQVNIRSDSQGLHLAFGNQAAPAAPAATYPPSPANTANAAESSALEERLATRLASTLDQRLGQLEYNQQLLLNDKLDALDTEQTAEQQVLARAVLNASQQLNRNDLQTMLKLLDTRLSRQEKLTRQGFAVLLRQQVRDGQRLDDLDDTLNNAVLEVSAQRGNQL